MKKRSHLLWKIRKNGNILLHFAAICLTGANTNDTKIPEFRSKDEDNFSQSSLSYEDVRRKIAHFPTSTTLTFSTTAAATTWEILSCLLSPAACGRRKSLPQQRKLFGYSWTRGMSLPSSALTHLHYTLIILISSSYRWSRFSDIMIHFSSKYRRQMIFQRKIKGKKRSLSRSSAWQRAEE